MWILAMEPYYGGSHGAFLDGWIAHSRHQWTLLTLPPYKWKWRMRHAAVTFAEWLARCEDGRSFPIRRLGDSDIVSPGEPIVCTNTEEGVFPPCWDLLFCSDMLNLAELVGVVSPAMAVLPRVAYFHENQWTYPVRVENERDYQFGMTNITTAVAATQSWYNSAFHRDEFFTASERFLKRMPDYQPLASLQAARQRTRVMPPGIALPETWTKHSIDQSPVTSPEPDHPGTNGPLRILWAARWEHDKNPDDFFAALSRLKQKALPFELAVVGEVFRDVPAVFAQAREAFSEHIHAWGWQESRQAYHDVLHWADVVVSTAHHEFFGLSVLEAVARGCVPVLPRRLAYPELFDNTPAAMEYPVFYDGSVTELTEQLAHYAARKQLGTLMTLEQRNRLTATVEDHYWPQRAGQLDEALEAVLSTRD